ncbi:hypothetical protein MTO96_029321 [Rhipicephalus appendiculatus]
MLGDLAIEGGNFTTAFFKHNTLKDLFGTDFDMAVEFEKALGMAEEELDVQAAHTARAEAAAELAEFDESIPLDTDSRDEDKSQAEEELDKLMDQLTPVERYAMQFLESLQEPLTLEQLKQAEEEIEAQKKDWELGRLKAIKEEEERRAGYRDDEEAPALVYSREDAYTQVPKSGRERRSSRGGSGGVSGAKSGAAAARQVNGTAAAPKRTSKRRAAAAAAISSTTDKVPQQQEEATAPHKKKRAVSPVHNHRHHQLLPSAQPETTHQRTRHKLGAAPCKPLPSSAAGEEEVRPQVANKHPPEHKNQVPKKIKVADKLHSPSVRHPQHPTADKTKVTDRSVAAVKPPSQYTSRQGKGC